MNSETLSILDQISGAINTARTARRMVYVYKDAEGWGYSGALPASQADFYIIYSDGSFDKTGSVPPINNSDWNEWLASQPASPAFVEAPPREKPRWKGWNIVTGFKKIFIGYCAFAPHAAMMLCVLFQCLTPVSDFWTFTLFVTLFCSPLSAIFALAAIHRPKDGKVATVATILASDAHILFYFGLWVAAYHGATIIHPVLFAIGFMISAAASGLALLLMWDNEAKATS